MNATWKAVIGVILVFILGWIGGALTTFAIAHHRMIALVQHDPEQLARLLERQATRGLSLDEDKKKQLHALIVENIRQRIELQKQIQPQVKVANAQTLQQINALLTTDQQQRFHDNLLTLKRRFGRNPFNVKEDEAATSAQPTTNASATGEDTKTK